MTGGHQAVLEADGVIQHFYHRRQTVGGAGGVGEDPVAGRVEVCVVNPIDKGSVELFPGGAQNNSLGSGPEVPFIGSPVPKGAGGFQDDIHPQLLPGEAFRVQNPGDPYFPAINDEIFPVRGHSTRKPAVDRIIFKEMNIPGDIGPGVDGHQFQVLIGSSHEPGETPADTPEAIDSYSDHCSLSIAKYSA